ncbi:MAG: Gfo/Idh/MocA family oxidoreductase, partial [Planctomycetota bacterium]
SSLAWAGATVILRGQRAHGFMSANDRPTIGAVGTGSRWYIKATGIDKGYGSAPTMRKYGDYIAVCDADTSRRERAGEIVTEWTGKAADVVKDYRKLIDRDDIDCIHISTPEHWHAKVAIEAMKSGKDVYCEKPMTLTIEEGQQICQVAKSTGRIMQVGTQQRSNMGFIKAIALIRDGRIGEVKKATCSIGGGPTSPELPVADAPKDLDWDLWQGPVEAKDFRYLAGDHGETKAWSRGHYEFRWWYEYSGGKLTDWGAHHVDIATWGLGKEGTGPVKIDPIMVKHPVEFKDGYPVDPARYNTATQFEILATFADGKEIEIRHDGGNGILFEGTEGRIFVNRGRLTGKPVEELETNPLPDGAIKSVYKDRDPTDHMENFAAAMKDRNDPISDVYSHHRALSTCHLAAIAARLGRVVKWDPAAEKVVDDAQAQGMVARPKRKGFEIEV